MSDRQYLECILSALMTYQRSRDKPSVSVSRVVATVEREIHWQECNPLPAEQVINNLILGGSLQESQREWAVHFYERDQVEFWKYLKMERALPESSDLKLIRIAHAVLCSAQREMKRPRHSLGESIALLAGEILNEVTKN